MVNFKFFLAIFWLLSFTKKAVCHLTVSLNKEIPNYTNSMIRRHTASDASRNHDVVFLRIERRIEDPMFDDIVAAVLDNNPDNPAFIHTSSKAIGSYRVHETSFIVVTTDMMNLVIILFKQRQLYSRSLMFSAVSIGVELFQIQSNSDNYLFRIRHI